MTARRRCVDEELAGVFATITRKDLRYDCRPRCILGSDAVILPCNDKSTICQSGDCRLGLKVSRYRVNKELVAAFVAIGVKYLRSDGCI